MRITSKGQVTIPVEIRERFGLMPNTEVEFVIRGNTVRLQRAQPSRHRRGGETRGERAIRLLREAGQKSRIKYSADEILAMTRER